MKSYILTAESLLGKLEVAVNLWHFFLFRTENNGSIGAPPPQDKSELVFNHQADVITSNQCREISADGGDVPNETKAAKKKRKREKQWTTQMGGWVVSFTLWP